MQDGTSPSTMHETIIELLKVSLKYGIEYSQFWDLSLEEINIIIGSKKDFIEEQNKTTIITNFSLAQNIAVFVSRAFAGKQIPTLQETYPELFNEQSSKQASLSEEERREKAWRLYKEQMLDFANQHNAKRAKEGLDERGEF